MSVGAKYIIDQNENGRIQDRLTLNIILLEEQIEKVRKKECKNKIKPHLFKNLEETHYVFMKKWYKPSLSTAYEWTKEQVDSGTFVFGSKNRFLLPLYGDFIGECILYLKLTELSTTSNLDKCGYSDFLGHKIMNYVSIEFSGVTIDEYYSDAYNVYYNYHVQEDKKKSWLRSVGQEYPQPSLFRQSSSDEYREQKFIVNGPQTPKQKHDSVELYIPILFDFCLKPHCALFSKNIPFGQRFINIDVPKLEELIFVENNGGGGNFNPPKVECYMWVNQFFVHSSLSEELKKKDYNTMIRCFKSQYFNAKGNDNYRLDNIRLQSENIYIGYKPSSNISNKNWYKFHVENIQLLNFPSCINTNQLAFSQVEFSDVILPIKSLFFTSKDNNLNADANSSFYSILQPLTKSISPIDKGLLLYSFAQRNNQTIFCDYSENDNISTYFNISNAKEFSINYKLDANYLPGTFFILSRSLNFFIVRSTGVVEILYKS